MAIIGLSATLGIFTWPTVWRRAGLLTSLFILVSSAELGLTFPHWAMSLRVTPDQLERPEHYFAIAVVGITWLVAIVLTAPVARDTLRLARSVLTPMRALFLSAVFLVTAANVAAYYPQLFEGGYQAEKYVRWLVAAGSFLALNILVLWHLARALPSAQLKALSERITRWISLPGEEGPTKPLDAWVPWGLSIFVLAVTVFFARVVLAGTAQFSDEVVYQFMADVYASGALRAPAPPVPEAFEMYMVEVGDGLRYGVFIPGWPLVLAIGAFFGIPWLVNPVLGALSVPAAHALTRRLTDRGTAHVVALLMATSPWFVILSSVYQPHAVTLLTALLTWLGMHHAKTHGGHAWALMAGLAAGVAFSVRPLDGLVIGGAAGLFAILKVGGRRAHLKLFAIYLFGCLATGSVSLWINHALTGDALTYASNVYFDRVWGVGANRLGFGPDVGRVWGGLDPIPGHGIPDVLFNVNLNLFTLNYEMLGWGIGSLFLAVLHLAWGRLSRIDRVAIAFIVGGISIYSLYWFNGGPDYGPRYWYSTLFPLLLLSARGLSTLVNLIRARTTASLPGARVGVLVGVLAFSGIVVYGSWRAVGKYVDYRTKTPLFAELLEGGAFGSNGLVLVASEDESFYAALELNELVPGSSDRPVFARDLGPAVTAALVEAFPGRPVYRAKLTITPEGKRVTVQPLQP